MKSVPNLDEITDLSQHRSSTLVGDFNTHSASWGYNSINTTSMSVDVLDHPDLVQISSKPTFLSFGEHASFPDLTSTSDLIAIADVSLQDAI
ncbi:hypothetical protein NPIL_105921 [Nephila pilipes]|uniref:Endonuclease/exonuclease/phosphatase domain-containing protein n=1 Tax=Nephila pilipes TaxID=299642 RepID=A0A8X6QD24_NEPPI|nr:hypothetical protein NPIL_105921 [Nephila pilipes]